MEKVLEYLKACGTFYIATVEDDQPRVRPFGCVTEYEGKLYVETNNRKEVYKQLIANSKTEICGMHNGTWIRVTGELAEDTRREARAAMMEDYKETLSSMCDIDDNHMTVFKFTHATATIYSFTSEPEVIEF